MNRLAGLGLAAAAAIAAGLWLGSAWHTRSEPAEQAGATAPPRPAGPPGVTAGEPGAKAAEAAGAVALRAFDAVPMAPEASRAPSKEAIDRPPQRSFENYPRHSGR